MHKGTVSEYRIEPSFQDQLEHRRNEIVRDDTDVMIDVQNEGAMTSQPVNKNQCTLCGKVLTKKHNLPRHMAVHSMEKRHRCPVCQKAFARKDVLEKHKVLHTGEKSYQCHLCGKFIHNMHTCRGTFITLICHNIVKRRIIQEKTILSRVLYVGLRFYW
ncbi:hypothetical protein ACJMK2_020828 [Sinanodonta woodiana]|uniref:C2H2-type domain-containing protein n=1 Tax=Sinanodonta woodiana TaxID=1069815 RepID=A0ABD3U1C4_SINWO